jgi:5-methylcytosine-specific restriction protein A
MDHPSWTQFLKGSSVTRDSWTTGYDRQIDTLSRCAHGQCDMCDDFSECLRWGDTDSFIVERDTDLRNRIAVDIRERPCGNVSRQTQDMVRGDYAARKWTLRPTIIERDGSQCQLCGATERLEIDHRIPVARGGTNDLDNLWTLCYHCNRAKACMTDAEFVDALGNAQLG